MGIYDHGIDWNKANCEGLNVSIFYDVEEKRTAQSKVADITVLRAICTACPIWKECLTYGSNNENYGVWGGLTTLERKSFSEPKYYELRARAIYDMQAFHKSEADLREAILGEVSPFERSSDNVSFILRQDFLPFNERA